MQHPDYPSDVSVIRRQEREFILIGTAHVSRESADLVREVITREHPDGVCVELDEQRFAALAQQQRWDNLDLREIIRRRQLGPLLVNLVLASYQKKLGGQLGLMPGAEMLEAIHIAQAQSIPLTLCDRDVRITLRRAWRLTPWYKKTWLLSMLLASMFDREPISEDTLRDLRQQDVVSVLIHEIGDTLPTLRQVILDERDHYLAQRIQDSPGTRVVVVVGAAHVQGIQRLLHTGQHTPLDTLTYVPPGSAVWRWVGWGIPATLIAALLWIGWQKGAAAFGESMLYWTLASGLPSALGAVCALAHPMTIVAAFISAPITTLSPAIGVGQVTALVQAYLRPPRVRELQSVADDIRSFSQWWQNRLLRIFLAFLLPSLGTMFGVWVGGYKILSALF